MASYRRSSRSSSRSSACSRSSSSSEHSRPKEGLSLTTCSKDDSFLGENRQSLPTSTSRWDSLCLEKLGIFYHNEYFSSPLDILDKAYKETGCFGATNSEQKQYIDLLKGQLQFNCSMREFDEIAFDSTQNRISEILGELRDQFLNMRRKYLKENIPSVQNVAEEFIHDVANILRYEAARYDPTRLCQGPVTEALYTTAFTHFARMCRVEALPGSLWRSKMTVLHTNVTSTADVLLKPLKFPDSLHLEFAAADSVSVVSVVEVEKAAKKKFKESEDYSSSSIHDYLDQKILGQHGGELLLHIPFYEKKLTVGKQYKYILPGMIVIGTEVIFTLLETGAKHLKEIYNKGNVDHNAQIYYSVPKDLLKEDDRNILMEAIIRLNNMN